MTRSLGTFFILSAVAAAPATAAGSGSTQISGVLSPSCIIAAPPPATFDPAVTTQQSIGAATYQCNFIGLAELKFWSTNGGQVVMPAGPANGNVAQMRAYALDFDGSNLGQVGDTSATASVASRSISVSNTDQAGQLKIQLSSAASVAGTYSDTIFMSIAP